MKDEFLSQVMIGVFIVTVIAMSLAGLLFWMVS